MATQLSDGLWHVDCQTLDHPNVYIVDDGNCTLVDAGWPSDEATVRTGLSEAGFRPSDIDRVLLTHYDADHVGTLARLAPALDAPVFAHYRDAPYVDGNRLPPWTARNGLEALHRLYYQQLELPSLPIRQLEDGDKIGQFRVYHTPGHTPGHIVYVHTELSTAFLGDLAFEVGGRLRASGRITSYNPQVVRESISTLLDRTHFEYVCPGHGHPLKNGYEQLLRTIE